MTGQWTRRSCTTRQAISSDGLTIAVLSCSVLLCVSAACAQESTEAADLRLQALIEDIHTNERLYKNIDVNWLFEYDIGDRQPSNSREMIRQQASRQWVLQNDLHLFKQTGVEQSVERASIPKMRINAFDGTKTKLYYQNVVGNVVSESRPDSHCFTPHMVLKNLATPPQRIPLSTYLEGMEAARAHPFGKKDEHGVSRQVYAGEDMHEGLKCHKVLYQSLDAQSNEVTASLEFWLAQDRNLLPIRLRSFKPSVSQDVATGEGTLEDLREIAPGVWFPFSATFTAFDKDTLKKEQQLTMRWRRRITVEKVDLAPKYPLSFFQSVEFPKGTIVYEVEGGKIVNSYQQGSPASPGGGIVPRAWWMHPWVWINGPLLLLLGGYLTVRHRRVSTRRAATTGAP